MLIYSELKSCVITISGYNTLCIEMFQRAVRDIDQKGCVTEIKRKGVYATVSAMVYGNETWAMNAEQVGQLEW